jgi:hypothetical protein
MSNSPSSTGSPWFPTFARLFRWFPPFARLFRRLFNWRTLGRILVGLAAIATFIALVCAEENWRGKRAWERYKHQLEAQGEKLDWKDYVSPPVPDGQNFAMTPFLAPLFDFNPEPRKEGQSLWRDASGYNRICSLQSHIGTIEQAMSQHNPSRAAQRMTDLQGWAAALTGKMNDAAAVAAESAARKAFRRRYGLRGPGGAPEPPPAAAEPASVALSLTRAEAAAEVLRGLEEYNPVVDELRSASQRPYAQFNIHYDTDIATAILLPHLATVKSLTMLFQVRASAELALGRTDQAWADTKMALYLADTVQDEPFVISKLVQVAIVQIALRPIWEGLAERKWSDAQLVEIEQRLSKVNLLADAAMRGERALDILVVDQARNQGRLDPEDSPSRLPGLASLLLGGFYYQNELSIARMYQQFVVPVVDAANQRVYPSRTIANDGAAADSIARGFRPYKLFAKMLLPAISISKSETMFAFGQTRVNEAIVACALERYRLAEGQFPASLEPLSPRFLQLLPHDLITGAPLLYRRTPNGQFILYSVGWNEKDDGGSVEDTHTEPSTPELTEADWVWQYPAPSAPPAQNAARP